MFKMNKSKKKGKRLSRYESIGDAEEEGLLQRDYFHLKEKGVPSHEATSAKKRYIPKFDWKTFPYFIVLISTIDVVMLGISLYLNKGIESWTLNPLLGPSPEVLIKLGAKYSPLIRQGQWWRYTIKNTLFLLYDW
jgi:hypothetical protein